MLKKTKHLFGVIGLLGLNKAMKTVDSRKKWSSDDKVIDLLKIMKQMYGDSEKYEVIAENLLNDLQWYLCKLIEYFPHIEVRHHTDLTNVNVLCHLAELSGLITKKEKEKLLKHFHHAIHKKRERVQFSHRYG